MNTLDALDAQSQRTDLPDFRAGDTLTDYQVKRAIDRPVP